jgi:flagellar hook protein FlgE
MHSVTLYESIKKTTMNTDLILSGGGFLEVADKVTQEKIKENK